VTFLSKHERCNEIKEEGIVEKEIGIIMYLPAQ
jgi:hypothetical protein